MRARDAYTRFLRIAFVALLAAISVVLTGCGGEPLVAEEGQLTCAECHIDRDMLQADLEADPLPEKVVAESEGEG